MKLIDLPLTERIAFARGWLQEKSERDEEVLIDALISFYNLPITTARQLVEEHLDSTSKT